MNPVYDPTRSAMYQRETREMLERSLVVIQAAPQPATMHVHFSLPRPSASDVKPWFKEDICSILNGLAFASGETSEDYQKALIAVALVFGITSNVTRG